MSIRLLVACTTLLLLAGCGRWRNQLIAGNDGLGREWNGAPGQLRLAVDNHLAREIVVYVDAPDIHLKMTVGPASQRHMIVPSATYKFSCFYSDDRELGNNYIFADDGNGAKGWLLDVTRP